MYLLRYLFLCGVKWICLLVGNGSWTTIIQTRQDSENYVAATSLGTYITKIKEAINATVINTITTFATLSVTAANMQSFFLMTDQGTVANPVLVTFTLSTGTLVFSCVANVPIYWDANMSQIANPFVTAGYSPLGAVRYTIPTAIGVPTNITMEMNVN